MDHEKKDLLPMTETGRSLAAMHVCAAETCWTEKPNWMVDGSFDQILVVAPFE